MELLAQCPLPFPVVKVDCRTTPPFMMCTSQQAASKRARPSSRYDTPLTAESMGRLLGNVEVLHEGKAHVSDYIAALLVKVIRTSCRRRPHEMTLDQSELLRSFAEANKRPRVLMRIHTASPFPYKIIQNQNIYCTTHCSLT